MEKYGSIDPAWTPQEDKEENQKEAASKEENIELLDNDISKRTAESVANKLKIRKS